MILDDIKKANVTALKEKDTVARSIYSIVMTKAMQQTIVKREKGEELVDADMVAILQKTIHDAFFTILFNIPFLMLLKYQSD